MSDEQLEQLVASILGSAKYRAVDPQLVRNIGARELAKRRPLKEAIKATRSKLHQVGAAYQTLEGASAALFGQIRAAAAAGDQAALRRACAAVMEQHASTRERLPILGEFYAATLAEIGPVRSVVDIACGLHPLGLPWMGLGPDLEYHAYDVYEDMLGWVGTFLESVGVAGAAHLCDVTQSVPAREADLAFVLKALPCLEQIDKSASLRLLEGLRARHMLVSFPIQSLGGRQKGMAAHYEAHFRGLVAGQPWAVRRFQFATELAFLVSKQPGPSA